MEVDWDNMEGGTVVDVVDNGKTIGSEGWLDAHCGTRGSWLHDCGWDGEALDRFCCTDDSDMDT